MWSSPIVLIEHHLVALPKALRDGVTGLQSYLDGVWASRSVFYAEDVENSASKQQPFLKFERRKGRETIKAGQYVGFIQYGGQTIQILPKVFKQGESDIALRHLLWWLDYSERVNFPFADLLSDSETIDNFPDALIRYFARFAHTLVNEQPYHQYQEVTETMTHLRGRLNIQGYVNNSLSRGNWHQLVCDYEPFQFNNRLNQIIKYVARQLTYLCRLETRRQLEQILFVLDEVDDCPCIAQDCDAVLLNRFFHQYEHCLDMCRFFLRHQYISQQDAQQRHFCFLVPMDRVYEDLIASVIKRTFTNQFTIKPQATDYLASRINSGDSLNGLHDKVFQIKNDLLLTSKKLGQKGEQLIVDMKYKIRQGNDEADKKAGVSQTDMYQMVSYALRRNTRQVLLLYPVRQGAEPTETVTFTVSSAMIGNEPIRIRAAELRITSDSRERMEAQLITDLESAFSFLGTL
ncbi:McrC family protein [Spirosoma rhododendri]|uniref:Restriction endonuclease n=1 Tax=Spirosoma rhododendri TaxID=2728024 RepID=A0A7L5DU55_9BACT|nr:hypothetical protein [Spirosoma rhododendri]QJD81625.1 hypothetical protein HH216_25090 [Spirosoma rhododendri]